MRTAEAAQGAVEPDPNLLRGGAISAYSPTLAPALSSACSAQAQASAKCSKKIGASMFLKRFIGKKIHGYLNFDIQFDGQLHFLTGINGSGKTTVLNSIIALLLPNMRIIAELEYDRMKIEFTHSGKNYHIEARKTTETSSLTTSNTSESLTINPFTADPDAPPYRQQEGEQEYYRDYMAANSANKVLQFILNLPTPMYLGLDRRVYVGEETRSFRYRAVARRKYARRRNVFGGTLEGSFLEAIGLADDSRRDASFEQNDLTRSFQQKFMLELIQTEPIEFSGSLNPPPRKDLDELSIAIKQTESLPELLDLPRDDVLDRINPFASYLSELANRLKNRSRKQENREMVDLDDPLFNDIVNWTLNQQHIRKVRAMAEIIRLYNIEVRKIYAKSDQYLDALNTFFADGEKKARFTDRGLIEIVSLSEEKPRSFEILSSGEIQMFVILTHLYFNPLAQKANVFIIDEPELSLHVHWQEKFVDSVIEANVHIQHIMATHSPSIIAGKLDRCIELAPGGN